MSNITLNIVAPDTPTPTPVDPVAPNTGLFTHGIGSSEATIIAVSTILLLAIVALVVFAILHKKKTGKSLIRNNRRITTAVILLAIIASAGTFIALARNAALAVDTDEEANDETGLTVDVSSEELTIEVADEPVFAVMPVEVTVEEATLAGYTLTAYADSTDLVSTTDSSKVIPMVAADEGELVALADNTYGLALEEKPTTKDEAVYTALSTDSSNPTILKAIDDYSSTPANDTTTIYYGFYITPDTPYGTYTGSNISVDATANIATVTFDANGLYFNDSEEATTNTVGYKPNIAEAPIEEVVGEYLTPAPLTPVDPSTTIHYTFLGWSEEEGATTPTYTSEEDIIAHLTLEPNESITLHAVWHYNTVLSFNGNGGSTTTPMLDRTIPAGTTEPLPANTYSMPGAVFLGWNTEETPTPDNPGRTYEDGAPFTAPEGSQDITLYAQWKVSTLYDKVAAMSKGPQTLAQLQEDITAPTTDDPSTDQSNSGVYEYNSSVFGEASDASSANKIYYYRGILEQAEDQGSYGSDGKATTYPNYVKLANNTCWRIVRTTGSGGVKMVYNGVWTGSTCGNSTTNAQLTTSPFNDSSATVAGKTYTGLGYQNMHAIGYTYSNVAAGTTSDTALSTLLGATGNDTTTNTNSSIIKQYIEDWYSTNMVNTSNSSYTSILEGSAGYCNDRSVYNDNSYEASTVLPDSTTVTPYGNDFKIVTIYSFGARNRNLSTLRNPTLTCPRSVVDIYSTTTNSGNSQLAHPIALLTADELSFAGSGDSSYNAKSYLRSGSYFWLLSPSLRASQGQTREFSLYSGGRLNDYRVNSADGVRPAISLKPGTTVVDGDGTATNPWTIDE